MDVLRRFTRTRMKGSTLAEFIYTVPAIIFLGLGSVQAGLIYHGKTTLNYATFEAAREGAVNHAQFDAIKSELSYRLAPIYGGDGTTAKAAQAIAHSKAASLLPQRTTVRILNPTPEAFNDWGEISLEDNVRAIPNSHLRNRNTERNTVGNQSGLNLHDANLLKIKVTHGFEMKIPLVNTIIATGMAIADPSAANAVFYAQNQIPLTSIVTVRMQNEAWEQDWEAGVTPPLQEGTAGGSDTAGTTGEVPAGEATGDTTTGTTGGTTGATGATTEGTTTATDLVDGGTTEPEPIQCDTEWTDERYQGSADDSRWWHTESWGADIKAAAAVVWDFMEGLLAGIGDQVQELWDLLKDPSVLWDLAKAFYDDPKGTLTSLVEGVGADVQRVLNCGPKDIGQIIGQNVNPVAIVKIIGKLSDLTGNAKLASYKNDLDQKLDCTSFPQGTPIWAANGNIAIENISIGSFVNSRSDSRFDNKEQPVTNLYNRIAPGLSRINTEYGVIEATAEHPFWVQGKGWTEAKDIEWEDSLATINGDVLAFENEFIDKDVKVYNFSVAHTETYFVGEMGLWVHNVVCYLPTKQSPSGYRIGSSDGGPGGWREINRPDTPAYQYQEQITGAPRGREYSVNGVDFDGYDAETGALLDAKRWTDNCPLADCKPEFVKEFGRESILTEARGQVSAAGNTPIEWHVVDPEIADIMRDILEADPDLAGKITVKFVPE